MKIISASLLKSGLPSFQVEKTLFLMGTVMPENKVEVTKSYLPY